MRSGGLRSDERPGIAQAGEFMIRKSAVDALGLQALRMINQAKLPVRVATAARLRPLRR